MFHVSDAICHHLPPSGLSGETARTPPHVRSQTNRTTEFFRLPVDCGWRTCSANWPITGGKSPSQADELRRADSPKRRRLRQIRTPTAHILWRRFPRLLLVNVRPTAGTPTKTTYKANSE